MHKAPSKWEFRRLHRTSTPDVKTLSIPEKSAFQIRSFPPPFSIFALYLSLSLSLLFHKYLLSACRARKLWEWPDYAGKWNSIGRPCRSFDVEVDSIVELRVSLLSENPWASQNPASHRRRGSSGGSVRFGNQVTFHRRRFRIFSCTTWGISGTWRTRIRGRLQALSPRSRDRFFRLAGGSGLIRRTTFTFLVGP